MKRLARQLALAGGSVALRAAETNFFVPTDNGSNITLELASPVAGPPAPPRVLHACGFGLPLVFAGPGHALARFDVREGQERGLGA